MNDCSSAVSELLRKKGYLRKVFEAIELHFSSAVLLISDLCSNYIGMPEPSITKDSIRSDANRKNGNHEFKKKNYGSALSFYNMALMNAPPGSYSMGQAYYNRSVLLLKLGKTSECMHDRKCCENCEIPLDLNEKVVHRPVEMMYGCSSPLSSKEVIMTAYEKYFKLKGLTHKKIPCASASIQIKDGKILAVKEIKAGEVISAETAFASCVLNTNIPLLCHYCHQSSLILKPCPDCCFAMFCSTKCSKESYEKVHKVECKIYRLGILENVRMRVAIQAVLKALVASNGWMDLATQVRKAEKSKEYYIEGPYDSSAYLNLCTPLNYEQLTHYGVLFDLAVQTSFIIHTLCRMKSIVPHEKTEELLVKQFLADQIMGRAAKTNMNIMSGAVISEEPGKEVTEHAIHENARGLFPFSKLYRHDCHPNTRSFGVGRELIVVALTAIPPGAEITTSYWQHFTLESLPQRKLQLFTNFGIICKCRMCLGWCQPTSEETKKVQDVCVKLEELQRKKGEVFFFSFHR